jgi:hypothetical protein
MPDRGHYDRGSVYAILDEGFVCHLGFVSEGQPLVVPTVYGRVDDVLYLHGAPANHALRSAATSESICLTVTLVDALVLARSAFHQSVNYRSVMAFGVASEVSDLGEKRRAVEAIVDHVLPGRSSDARPPSDAELRATRVVRFQIAEASAKVRTGGPKEEPEDLDLEDVWAGEVPLELSFGALVVDDQAPVRAPAPSYITTYTRPSAR